MIDKDWKPIPEHCLVGLMAARCWGCHKVTTIITKKTSPLNIKQAIDETKQIFKDNKIFFLCMNCAAKMSRSVAINFVDETYTETNDGAERFNNLVGDPR